jgi:hypothetical protein
MQYPKGVQFYFSNRNLDAAIKPIPKIPMTIAIPVVSSPKIRPSHIKKAPVNANKIPNTNITFWYIVIILSSFTSTLHSQNIKYKEVV